jgi:DNA-binding NarL/FixJ family response regulator
MVNVLIAEDNAAYRQSLHRVLTGRFPFMRITEAADGTDALHQALSRQYDLIFMDVRLPQRNGLDITRAIKSVFADSIVLVITSYDLPEYREAAFRHGADRFLVKGDTSGEELVAMIESLLLTRFRTLIITSDTRYRRQLATLLAIHWPAMLVAEAESAAEGLDRAASLRPDLVLLDLDLPDVRPANLLRELRSRSGQPKFIGMTGNASHPERMRALACGVDYCVPLDPVGHTELVTIVKALRPDPAHH